MTSSVSPWLACLFAAVGALSASVSPARACDGDEAVRWLPERSWPAACEKDVPTDGLVFLEGPARNAAAPGGDGLLRVQIKRMVEGEEVETFDGEVADADRNAAVFRSKRPLAPGADYILTAQRVSPDGTPLSAPFTSAFTTGHAALAPLRFEEAPTLQLEAFDKELVHCDEADACGAQRCKRTGETTAAQYVRIAVPPVEGGLTQRPYTVSAALTTSGPGSQASVVATADVAAVQAGKRSYMVIEVPSDLAGKQGCVVVTATDLAGHTESAAPVCLALPASTDAADESSAQHADALRLETTEDDRGASEAEAGGCAVGQGDRNMGGLAWLSLVFTMTLLRSRKRRG